MFKKLLVIVAMIATIALPTQVFAGNEASEAQATVAPGISGNLGKTVVFTNVAVDVWAEIGSYTVTIGKRFGAYDFKLTSLFSVEGKISLGTAQDIYLATAPACPNDYYHSERPISLVAGTVIRVYVKSDEAKNSGSITWNGVEVE